MIFWSHIFDVQTKPLYFPLLSAAWCLYLWGWGNSSVALPSTLHDFLWHYLPSALGTRQATACMLISRLQRFLPCLRSWDGTWEHWLPFSFLLLISHCSVFKPPTQFCHMPFLPPAVSCWLLPLCILLVLPPAWTSCCFCSLPSPSLSSSRCGFLCFLHSLSIQQFSLSFSLSFSALFLHCYTCVAYICFSYILVAWLGFGKYDGTHFLSLSMGFS